MASFELATHGHLSAAPGRVWANLVDGEAAPCWLEGVSAVVSDGDQIMIRLAGASGQASPHTWDPGGSPTTLVGRGGRSGWISAEVLEAAPRRRLALRLDAPAVGLREVLVEVVLAASEGGTRFDMRVVGRPTVVGAFFGPLLRLRAEVEMARAVRGFRAAVEARSDRKGRRFAEPCAERERAHAGLAPAALAAAG